jgi:uncharacterized glyoxalase superfamily protein PhnB
MSDNADLDALRELRPDRLLPDEPNTPHALAAQRQRLLGAAADSDAWSVPSLPTISARLAYRDIYAALEFLVRVFGFRERRESRLEHPMGMLTWLEIGDGVVMISEDGPTRHELYSPLETGKTTVMINVYVSNIDAHYQRAAAHGARIVLDLSDTFWGDRRYEALDLEGHRWHFAETLASIRRREGADQ